MRVYTTVTGSNGCVCESIPGRPMMISTEADIILKVRKT